MTTGKEIKPIEGEIVKQNETIQNEIREAGKRGGVFIGTLNIMAAPARHLITKPLTRAYHRGYHGKYKRPKHVFAFDAALVAIGILAGAAAIYFAFIYKPYDPIGMTLTLAPKRPSPGGELILTVEAKNGTADRLDGVRLSFDFPADFAFKAASFPFDKQNAAMSIGPIPAHSSVQVKIIGRTSAPLGASEKFFATLSYENAASPRIAEASLKMSESPLSASWELPGKIVVGAQFPGAIRYANKGNSASGQAAIAPTWPESFTLVSSDRALGKEGWKLGDIPAGSEGAINFVGRLDRAADPAAVFSADFNLLSGGKAVTQSQATVTAGTADPKISVRLNGASSARLGTEAELEAVCKNDGEENMNGLTLKIAPAEGFTAETLGKLPASLKPGEEAKIAVRVRINPSLPEILAKSTNPALGITAILSGELAGEGQIALSSPKWNLKIASSLGLAALARYWSDQGDQLGRGPLPPQIGKTTRYWVFWNVANTTGAVTDVRVSAVLPANVSFTGKASVPFGDMPDFDPATRMLSWKAGDIPAWPGSSAAAVGVAFEVALIPTANQAGTYPALVTGQKISGKDSASGLPLSGSASDITAHLTADPMAADTGTVRTANSNN